MSSGPGAALFKNALGPVASTSSGGAPALLNRMQTDSGNKAHSGPLRSSKGKGRAAKNAEDGDIGMQDASGASRRGRATRKPSGPMGDRTQRGKNNSPAQLKGGDKKSKPTAPAKTIDLDSSKNLEAIRIFLTSRYSPEHKMLNLESMHTDNVLREAGILPPGTKGASSSLAGAMWKMAKSLFPEVESIVLANNGLSSLLPLSPFLMCSYLPNIQNVSLANNSFKHVRDLDTLSPFTGKQRNDGQSKGWAHLRELVLTGNPMVVTGTGEAKYKSEIARRFPTLVQLDQQPFDPSTAWNVQASTAASSNASPGLSPAAKRSEGKKPTRPPIEFPLPIKGAFFDADSTRDFVAGFLSKFFTAYDSDRASLQHVYAPLCTFSFSADTTVPIRSRVRKIGGHGDKRFPNQHKLDWKAYLTNGSRNLLRTKRADKRFTTIQMSPADVTSSIMALPKTEHPLSQADKFVFDAFLMPGLLVAETGGDGTAIFVTVHGEFTELPTRGVRSFSRTFLLAPAGAGSAAQIAGWPCVIMSDAVCVRGYTEPTAWRPKAAPSATPANGTAPAQQLDANQQGLIKALSDQTRLNAQFAQMALEQNQWDPNLALANFNDLNSKGAIPREAFLP